MTMNWRINTTSSYIKKVLDTARR